jgi:mRNA interferase MazF
MACGLGLDEIAVRAIELPQHFTRTIDRRLGLTQCVQSHGGRAVLRRIGSSNAYNANKRDLLNIAITSQIRTQLASGETVITSWQAAGQIKPSLIKPVITCIEQHVVIRAMGPFSTDDASAAPATLRLTLG